MNRTPLYKCSVTGLQLPIEYFTASQQKKIKGEAVGTPVSNIGVLWNNVSARAVNGRYRASATSHGRSLSYIRKGIRLADEWVNDPTRFAIDVIFSIGMPRVRDGEKLTLDRIDNDGHYEPGNLRWATALEQVRNQSAPTY